MPGCQIGKARMPNQQETLILAVFLLYGCAPKNLGLRKLNIRNSNF